MYNTGHKPVSLSLELVYCKTWNRPLESKMCDPGRIMQEDYETTCWAPWAAQSTQENGFPSLSVEKKTCTQLYMYRYIETTDTCIFFKIDKTVEFQASSLMSEVTVIVQDIGSAKTPLGKKPITPTMPHFPERHLGNNVCPQTEGALSRNYSLLITFCFFRPSLSPFRDLKQN